MPSDLSASVQLLEAAIPSGPQIGGQRPAVEVNRVSKRYRRYARRNLTLKGRVLDWLRGQGDQFVDFDALKEVSVVVPRGQTVAILGRNGAGKSTLLRIIAQVAEPDTGTVAVFGRVSPLLELGAGFSLELTGRRNIYLYGALLGLGRREINEHLDEIVGFSEIGEFLDTPVKHYSSGMYLRLAFAVAAHVDPDVLLLDEVLAVGDAAFQAKCVARITDFRRQSKTILLVTHDTRTAAALCDRALLIDHGLLREDGPPAQVIGAYDRLLSS
jgi:ABC-type polysaccharide/polyol phosphate transport system ATPase subunit